MNKKAKAISSILLGFTLVLTGCSASADAKENNSKQKQEQAVKETKKENKLTKGQEIANILSSTNWQGTRVYDKDNNDLTKENSNFIGLAKYDVKSGRYEFFDAKTGESRGDKGTFFITNDGKK
ncbi:DUF4822 domain-containing protein, partial [Bacillus sp. JJ1503]